MLDKIKKHASNQSDVVFAFGVLGILLILFVPLNPQVLDIFLITNFSVALLILLLTFYVEKPLDFSTFPSLILIATLFRLALNISATRLILSDADAGQVIDAVGDHVVAGNYIIGIIVFLVLVVVQYVVVTSGAQRVAEVAARFTLDSMPGKQMAIDADLNAGLIDEEQARERRLKIEKEGNFYGAMDGASKFVKGDAIAGIVIILIDIIGGLAIGVVQMGMSWGQALHTFTLLTVGDGIVTQVPALILSTATGIIVTRASSDNYLSKEIGSQIAAYPKALFIVTFTLALLLLVPGIPNLPVLMLLTVFVIASYAVYKYSKKTNAQEADDDASDEDDIYQDIRLRPIELKAGEQLLGLFESDSSSILDKISNFRKQYAADYGFVFPKIVVTQDGKLAPNQYSIFINGAKVSGANLMLDKVLLISATGIADDVLGEDTTDPTYGLPAKWVDADYKKKITSDAYTVVEADTVLVTHIVETLKKVASDLLSRAEMERMTENIRRSSTNLVEELVPNVLTIGQVQLVIQSLVKERVPIHNLEAIYEVLVEHGVSNKDVSHLTELARQKLSPHISQSLVKDDRSLNVLTLDSEVEIKLAKSIVRANEQEKVVVEPKFLEQLLRGLSASVEDMMKSNQLPVLLTAPELRKHIKKLTERTLPQLSVISLLEISDFVELKAYGTVKI